MKVSCFFFPPFALCLVYDSTFKVIIRKSYWCIDMHFTPTEIQARQILGHTLLENIIPLPQREMCSLLFPRKKPSFFQRAISLHKSDHRSVCTYEHEKHVYETNCWRMTTLMQMCEILHPQNWQKNIIIFIFIWRNICILLAAVPTKVSVDHFAATSQNQRDSHGAKKAKKKKTWLQERKRLSIKPTKSKSLTASLKWPPHL